MVGNEASFRVAAAECVEAAVKSTDPDAAAKLLQMAQNWLDLAEERELKPLGPPISISRSTNELPARRATSPPEMHW